MPDALREAARPSEAPTTHVPQQDTPRPRRKGRGQRSRWWRDALRRRMLAAADLLAALVGSVLFLFAAPAAPEALVFALLPAWLIVAKLFDLYDRDQMVIRHLTIDELPRIAAWTATCTAGIGFLISSVITVGFVTLKEALFLWGAVAVCDFALRGAARTLWRVSTPREETFVIGDGELADAARRKIELFGDMHLRLADQQEVSVAAGNSADADALRALARRVDRVIVAGEGIDPPLISTLVGLCREEEVKLSVVSPLRGRAGAVPRLSEVADLPVLEYDTRDVSRSTLAFKRAFDVVVSVTALVVLAPLFALIAPAIRIGSPGPVFFTQVRAGRLGRPFRMYKFRTMYQDAESELEEMIRFDQLEDPMFKFKEDPRATGVGRFLRRFSLDELPQLLNVLRGQMSIVGPRPEQIELVECYRPEHRFRLAVKPGMTGPMQVFGRGELTFAERLAVELDYVEHMSLARDVRIVVQTVPTAIRGTGAF